MSVIQILSPHVADMIAAGEVVERPASVVKELVENAIDAGARNITVEIRGGGMRRIRVSDDGCGMSPEDAGTAFLRHATSKLRDERGLESISTLGFRGEALAAISAVSHIELLTRRRGDNSGTRVTLNGGDIQEMGPVGCPEGTTMCVTDLFYNTPARLKFMKSDKAEGSACTAMALRCALGHPEVSLRMIRDGEEQFFSPGDGDRQSAVYSLLGRDNARNMIACSGENEGVRVGGFISAPHAGRGNRAMQFFFLNGRAFKSQSLQAALEQAYKNTLLTGRFPGCALYIELSPGKVDVNVHPAKTEVKFSDEKAVFDAVYYACLSALGSGREKTAEIKLSAATEKTIQPRADFYRTMNAREYRETLSAGTAPAKRSAETPPVKQAPELPPLYQSLLRQPEANTLRSPAPRYEPSPLVPRPEIPRVTETGTLRTPPTGAREQTAVPAQASPRPAEVPADLTPPAPTTPIPDFRVVGEAMNTYILVEQGEELLLIDKHAAHERMIFDRLKNQPAEVMSQTLLSPAIWRCGEELTELLDSHGTLLAQLGFEIEAYGADSLIIRAVPADTDGDEIAMVEEIFEKLCHGGSVEERRDALLHTIACKAAIKAGWNTDDKERAVIAREVLSGRVRYCPHGRPVSVTLTKKELDKQFKRIV